MIIKLFNTKDSNNTLGKTLTNETSFDCKLKGQTEIISPVIVLKTETPININYAQIEEWGRFYFIKNVKYNPNGLQKLPLTAMFWKAGKLTFLTAQERLHAKPISTHTTILTINLRSRKRLTNILLL